MTTFDAGHPRIVSLLPSATEWICELGLAGNLVGVSHECDYPAAVAALPGVTRSRIDIHDSSAAIDQAVREHSDSRTSLFELDRDVLLQLSPHIVVTQTLCNVCAVNESEVRQALRSLNQDCQLLDLSGTTFCSVFADAQSIIDVTGNRDESNAALAKLKARIDQVTQNAAENDQRPKVTLLEWADPLFCAGHWTPELIEMAGGLDPIGRAGQPSRQIHFDELVESDPDILLVACCGLDLERCQHEVSELTKHNWFANLRCVRTNQVHVFDGSAWFNRPGPRLVDALESVGALIANWKSSV